MVLTVIVIFINLFVPVFSAILVLRIILSYLLSPGNRFMGFLMSITEPLLAPVRKILPPAAGLDFAPLAVLLLLQGLQTLASNLM
ncbi:MAG: hypothetical protein NVSMB39_7260 [Candidatus Saccharimonadales bacterium]